jgi:hypothetical protein
MLKNVTVPFRGSRRSKTTDTDKIGTPELEMELTPKATLLGFLKDKFFNQVREGFFGLANKSFTT